MKPRPLLLLATIPFLILGISWGLTQEPASASPQPETPTRDRSDDVTRTGARRTLVVRAIERVKTAVVNIHSERPGPVRPIQGMGTGILIDPRGYVVTNQHVVDEVTKLVCRLHDGRSFTATELTRDARTDLALIKIDPVDSLPTMPLGTASDLMIGETVMAIGNAFGYEHTASMGIVSAVKRDVNLNPKMKYESLIQTDASINPGNSGGPLINVHGELVGVNVAIRDKAQGIGFAITVDNMIRSVADMMHSRRRTYDGLVADDHLEETANGPVRSVVLKYVDAGSPAAVAGAQMGDVVLQMGDVHVQCSYDLERAVLDRKIDDKVPLVVRRGDREKHLEVVLSSLDRISQQRSASELIWSRLGVRLLAVPLDQMGQDQKQLHGGLEVTSINNEGPAARAGIRKGDILVGLHHWETVNLDNVVFVLNHSDLASFSPLSFFIVRSGQIRKGKLLN